MNLAASDGVILSVEAIAALETGNMIQAIKITRADTGLGLKAAKETVEAYLQAHPDIKEKFMVNKSTVTISQERILHLLILLAVILAYMLFTGKFS